MNHHFSRLRMIAVALAIISLAALSVFAQQNPRELFERARMLDESNQNLTEAIKLYNQVINQANDQRALAAKAQLRIGLLYDRLGRKAEAQRAFQAVASQYSDQADIARQARAKITTAANTNAAKSKANSAASARDKWAQNMATRQIWATSQGVTWNRVSPDGRSVAGIDGKTGDLVIRSLGTGETRRLTAIPKDRWRKDYADSPIWSRDGRQIAYWWSSGNPPGEFRIATVADGTSSVVPMDARFRLYSPQDWSPDGRRVLAIVEDPLPKIRSLHLAWVDTSDGAVQLLASASKGARLGSAFLAPDGAWIVSRIMEDDAGVSIMAAAGGQRRILIPFTPSDSLVGWSADGTHVLFISRESGSDDLMALRVVGGQTAGKPFLIRTLPGFSSLGVSQAGALLYQSNQSNQEPRLNLYRASFDATSGRVGPPSRVDPSTFHSNGSVSWSPDGRRLAYVSWAKGKESRTLSIWSAENAQTRSFSLPFNARRWGWCGTTWSADGRWVYVAGRDEASLEGLYRINIESGTAEAVLPPASGVFPMDNVSRNPYTSLAGWSPDAHVIYKKVTNFLENGKLGQAALVEYRLADHAERELFKSDTTASKVSGFDVSPDGSQLAFWLSEMTPPSAVRKLMVMPAAGGPAKTLATLPAALDPRVNWTPDGRSLVFLVSRSAAEPGERWLCDVATGAVRKLEMAPEMIVGEIEVSPSGKEIVYVGGLQGKDEGVWMLENFLPKPKAPTPPAKTRR